MSYSVAVRALCEFTAKAGDLDLRFTPSPTALEGITGHRTVAARRNEGYRAELALEGHYRELRVRGRADGYDPAQNQLEEIKTYRGDLARQPANHRQLHWAQARIYGWLACESLQLAQINLALVYFDIVSEKETLLRESWSADDLKVFFEQQCTLFLHWAEQEMAHRHARDQAARELVFPHGEFRPGQRSLAEDPRHSVSDAQGPGPAATGQGVLPHRQDPWAPARPRCGAGAARQPARIAVAGAGTGGPGQGPVPWRRVSMIACPLRVRLPLPWLCSTARRCGRLRLPIISARTT